MTANTEKLSVLLLAGRRPGSDPIADYFKTKYKVLAPVADKPMLIHTLCSLDALERVSKIFVVTQEPEDIQTEIAAYPLSDKVRFIKSDGGIADSILSVWQGEKLSPPLLVTTADNCLLGEGHVNDFLAQAENSQADLYLGLVEKTTLTKHYPESRRTWLQFKDTSVTGCNLFLLKNNQAGNLINFWKAFETSPKKVFKLAWTIGPLVFTKFYFKRLGLDEAFNIISSRSGTRVQPVKLNDPDVAIDADKVSDIVQIESILKMRSKQRQEQETDHAAPWIIFDLDRTITTHGTFLPFLIYFAWHKRPWRLLLLPVVIMMMLLYLVGGISRKRLKTIMQALLTGPVNKDQLNKVCESYVNEVLESKVNLDAIFTIRQWQTAGAKLVIATASFDWMADCFARRLGINNIIASASLEKGDKIIPGIDGENCYGKAKLAMIEAMLGNLRESQSNNHQVWLYTDHHSDIPSLAECSHPVAVNPSQKLSNWVQVNSHAQELHWNTRTVSNSFINSSDHR